MGWLLGTLALRLASTIANSVPSERSFSILQLLQNKLRSRLTAPRIDKLQYIYINERILERVANAVSLRKNTMTQPEPTEEELIEIEDALSAEGKDITTNPTLNKDVTVALSPFVYDDDGNGE
jgi:hypothetical protein